MQTTFTIEEIRNYLKSQDSMGDAMYNLRAENIIKANTKIETTPLTIEMLQDSTVSIGSEIWVYGNKEIIENFEIDEEEGSATIWLEGYDGEDHFELEECEVAVDNI